MSVMESPKKTTRFSPGEGGVGGVVAGELAEVVTEGGSFGVAVLLAGLVGREGGGQVVGPGRRTEKQRISKSPGGIAWRKSNTGSR
jgi:hypothetical protein